MLHGEQQETVAIRRYIASLHCPACGGVLYPEGCLVIKDGTYEVVEGGRCESCRRKWHLEVLLALGRRSHARSWG